MFQGLEENTLVASLCHLLERVWAHGRLEKQGKSALWSHLISYREDLRGTNTSAGKLLSTESAPTSPTHPLSLRTPNSRQWVRNNHTKHPPDMIMKRNTSLNQLLLDNYPNQPFGELLSPSSNGLSIDDSSVLDDMRHVERMQEIRTEIGYARAFLRLSLEKKILSRHLTELLSNNNLLRKLYKRYCTVFISFCILDTTFCVIL